MCRVCVGCIGQPLSNDRTESVGCMTSTSRMLSACHCHSFCIRHSCTCRWVVCTATHSLSLSGVASSQQIAALLACAHLSIDPFNMQAVKFA